MFKKIVAVCAMLVSVAAMAAVDVNKASESELDGIKGIGPGTSKTIMAERKKNAFKSWDDLIERVSGIGPARAAKLSAQGLTVEGASYQKPASTTAKTKPAASAAK